MKNPKAITLTGIILASLIIPTAAANAAWDSSDGSEFYNPMKVEGNFLSSATAKKLNDVNQGGIKLNISDSDKKKLEEAGVTIDWTEASRLTNNYIAKKDPANQGVSNFGIMLPQPKFDKSKMDNAATANMKSKIYDLLLVSNNHNIGDKTSIAAKLPKAGERFDENSFLTSKSAVDRFSDHSKSEPMILGAYATTFIFDGSEKDSEDEVKQTSFFSGERISEHSQIPEGATALSCENVDGKESCGFYLLPTVSGEGNNKLFDARGNVYDNLAAVPSNTPVFRDQNTRSVASSDAIWIGVDINREVVKHDSITENYGTVSTAPRFDKELADKVWEANTNNISAATSTTGAITPVIPTVNNAKNTITAKFDAILQNESGDQIGGVESFNMFAGVSDSKGNELKEPAGAEWLANGKGFAVRDGHKFFTVEIQAVKSSTTEFDAKDFNFKNAAGKGIKGTVLETSEASTDKFPFTSTLKTKYLIETEGMGDEYELVLSDYFKSFNSEIGYETNNQASVVLPAFKYDYMRKNGDLPSGLNDRVKTEFEKSVTIDVLKNDDAKNNDFVSKSVFFVVGKNGKPTYVKNLETSAGKYESLNDGRVKFTPTKGFSGDAPKVPYTSVSVDKGFTDSAETLNKVLALDEAELVKEINTADANNETATNYNFISVAANGSKLEKPHVIVHSPNVEKTEVISTLGNKAIIEISYADVITNPEAYNFEALIQTVENESVEVDIKTLKVSGKSVQVEITYETDTEVTGDITPEFSVAAPPTKVKTSGAFVDIHVEKEKFDIPEIPVDPEDSTIPEIPEKPVKPIEPDDSIIPEIPENPVEPEDSTIPEIPVEEEPEDSTIIKEDTPKKEKLDDEERKDKETIIQDDEPKKEKLTQSGAENGALFGGLALLLGGLIGSISILFKRRKKNQSKPIVVEKND